MSKMLQEEAQRHSGPLVSLRQLQAYADHLGFELTPANHTRVQQVVFSARAAACDAANDQLGDEPGDLGQWASDALIAPNSSIFDAGVTSATVPSDAAPQPAATPPGPAPAQDQPKPSNDTRSAKLLVVSMEDCITAFQTEQAWSGSSIEQVRTAIRLLEPDS